MSYLFYKHYLQTHIVPPTHTGSHPQNSPSPSEKVANQNNIEECERRIDAELAASMPASDAPSWTLGGSLISKRRH